MILNCNVGIITINYNNETYMRTEIVEMYYFYFLLISLFILLDQ